MNLKKLFPLSWKYSEDVANLAVGILMYIAAGLIAGAVIAISGAIIGWIPVIGAIIGWTLRIVSSIVCIYIITGIVISILVYTKTIK